MQNFGDLLKDAQKNQGKSANQLKKEAQAQPKPGTEKPKGEVVPRPNVGWLFYKDYYLWRENEVTGQFFTRFLNIMDSEIQDLEKQERQIKTQRPPLEAQRQEHDDWKRNMQNAKADLNAARLRRDGFFKEKNNALLKLPPDGTAPKHFNLDTAQNLPILRTGDKGMLVGTGIEHETGEQGEAKLGLQFDYATGQPYLPGSSLKGLLRSWFPGHRRTDSKNLDADYRKTRVRVLKKILCFEWGKSESDLEAELTERTRRWLRDPEANEGERFLEFLERQIFEGEMPDFDEKTGTVRRDANGKPVLMRAPMSRCDLFLDAYIVGGSGKLLEEDVITPHRHPLKDPVPLLFLKIAAGVDWQFQFSLQDCDLMSAKEKLAVFKILLTHFGVGAKRRHGFGELVEV
jgi:CRISPR-associated protein Cmr6